MKRFMTVGTITGGIFVIIFTAIKEIFKFEPSPMCDFFMTSDGLWALIFAAIIAGVDSLIYSAGQRLMESGRKYAYMLDGAFIRRKQEKERKLLLKATAAFDDGDYINAVVKLDKLMKKCEKNRDYYAVHCLYGTVCDKQNENSEALEHWKKAIGYEAGKAYGYCGIGRTYLRLKNYNEAIANSKKSIELDKNMYQAYDTLCVAYKAIGNEEKYEVFYKAVVALGRDTKKFNEELAAVNK